MLLSMFQNSLLVFLLFCINFPASQSQQGIGQLPSEKDDISRFEDGSGIWSIPTGCTSSCRGVSWKTVDINGDTAMEFRMTTSDENEYLAIAISKDTTMGNDDVYVCSKNGTGYVVSSGYLTGKSPPILGKPERSKDHVMLGRYISCTFQRPLLVSKTINGDIFKWNLGLNPFNLFFAEGQLGPNGQPLKHTFKASTSKAFDLFRTDGYKLYSPPVPSPYTPVASLPNVTNLSKQVHPLDNIEAKYGFTNRGTWYVPNNSCRNRICKAVHWQVLEIDDDGGWIQFIVTGSNQGWVAIAISRDTRMGEDDCYICSQAQPGSTNLILSSAYITEAVTPTRVEEDGDVMLQHSAMYDDVIACQFKRRLSITKSANGRSNTWDLQKETFHLLFAEGKVEDGVSLPHTFARYTSGSFYFLSNEGYKKDTTVTPTPQAPGPTPHTVDLPQVIREEGGYKWMFPNNCGNDCRTLQWKPTVHKGQHAVTFLLNAPTVGYAGFVITEYLNDVSTKPGSQLTTFGECYFCFLNSPNSTNVTIGRGNCTFSDIPVLIEELGSNWSPNASITSNMLTCSFVRPLARNISHGEKVVNHDLSAKNYYILYREGNVSKDGALQTAENSFALSEPLLNINISAERKWESTVVNELEEDKSTQNPLEYTSTGIHNETGSSPSESETVDLETHNMTTTADNLETAQNITVSTLPSVARNDTSDGINLAQTHKILVLCQIITVFIAYVV